MGNKISNITNSKADGKNVNPEFEYRYGTLKKLKASFKTLKKNIADAVINMEAAPQRLRDVGAGYANLSACLNHGGAGGASSRRQSRADGGEQAPASRTRIDRGLADESYHASQTFCTAMDELKTNTCAKYRSEINEKISNELDKLSLATERALAQGKKTEDSIIRFGGAVKQVSQRESAAAKKGKDLSSNPAYTKAVADRNARERSYLGELETFDQRYEEVMVESQEFCGATTDIFLDCVVGYYREMMSTLDVTETPQRSRVRERDAEPALYKVETTAHHEPVTDHNNDMQSSPSSEPLKPQS